MTQKTKKSKGTNQKLSTFVRAQMGYGLNYSKTRFRQLVREGRQLAHARSVLATVEPISAPVPISQRLAIKVAVGHTI